MPEKTPENLEGLTLGLIATGKVGSLGFEFMDQLISNPTYASQGIVGSNGTNNGPGITRILIYNRDENKTQELIKHVTGYLTKNTANGTIANPVLAQQLNKTFKIEIADKVSDIAEKSDVCFFMFDSTPREERRAALGKSTSRGVGFKKNMKVFYEWENQFENYKGLALFCTNPPDPITYLAPSILGLKRNQVIGFNNVDTHRLKSEIKNTVVNTLPGYKNLEPKEKKEVQNAINELYVYTTFMIGNHSAESFALFSEIRYGNLLMPWNSNVLLRDPAVKKQVIKQVHQRAGELSDHLDNSNKNCVPPLIDLLKNMVTGEEVCAASYYLKMISTQQKKRLETLEKVFKQNWKEYLKEKWNKEHKEGKREKEFSEEAWENYTPLDIKGCCTGVPIKFRRKGKIIRPYIAKGYKKSKYLVNTDSWNDKQYWKNENDQEVGMLEKDIFGLIVQKNVERIAEAILFKEIESNHRFLDKKTVPVIARLNSSKLEIVGYTQPSQYTEEKEDYTKQKHKIIGQTQLIQCEEKQKSGTKRKTTPKISCLTTTQENESIVASREERKTIHVIKVPNITLDNLARKENIIHTCENFDLGNFDGEIIIKLGLINKYAYLIQDNRIEKRDISNPTELIEGKDYDFDITSFQVNEKYLFCGTNHGKIKKIDKDNLTVVGDYSCPNKNSIIKLIKLAEPNIFCVTNSNEILLGDINSKKNLEKILETKNLCFDVQREYFLETPLICVYSLNEKYDVLVTPVYCNGQYVHGTKLQKDDILENKKFKRKIKNKLEDKSKIKQLRIRNNELFLLSDRGLISMLNKDDTKPEIYELSRTGAILGFELITIIA